MTSCPYPAVLLPSTLPRSPLTHHGGDGHAAACQHGHVVAADARQGRRRPRRAAPSWPGRSAAAAAAAAADLAGSVARRRRGRRRRLVQPAGARGRAAADRRARPHRRDRRVAAVLGPLPRGDAAPARPGPAHLRGPRRARPPAAPVRRPDKPHARAHPDVPRERRPPAARQLLSKPGAGEPPAGVALAPRPAPQRPALLPRNRRGDDSKCTATGDGPVRATWLHLAARRAAQARSVAVRRHRAGPAANRHPHVHARRVPAAVLPRWHNQPRPRGSVCARRGLRATRHRRHAFGAKARHRPRPADRRDRVPGPNDRRARLPGR